MQEHFRVAVVIILDTWCQPFNPRCQSLVSRLYCLEIHVNALGYLVMVLFIVKLFGLNIDVLNPNYWRKSKEIFDIASRE